MDSFESIIAMLLRKQGYWVTQSYRVALSQAEKNALGKPSLPRIELDVIAFNHAANELLVVECKSYLYSKGVKLSDVASTDSSATSRYKMFSHPRLRAAVFLRLKDQLCKRGMCDERTELRLGLAVGKFYSQDEAKLIKHFSEQGWQLYTPNWIREQLLHAADEGYENDAACVVSRLLGTTRA